MTNLGEVNESSTAVVTFSFYDPAGDLAAPASASYRIIDVNSGSVVKAETNIAPIGTTAVITLAAADTVMISTRPSEEKIITVEAVYAGAPTAEDFKFTVVNLRDYPFP